MNFLTGECYEGHIFAPFGNLVTLGFGPYPHEYLSWVTNKSGEAALYSFDLQKRNLRVIYKASYPASSGSLSPAFTPGGDFILNAFTASDLNKPAASGAHLYNSSTGEVLTIPLMDVQSVIRSSYLPDGNFGLLVKLAGKSGVFLYEIQPASGAVVVSSRLVDTNPEGVLGCGFTASMQYGACTTGSYGLDVIDNKGVSTPLQSGELVSYFSKDEESLIYLDTKNSEVNGELSLNRYHFSNAQDEKVSIFKGPFAHLAFSDDHLSLAVASSTYSSWSMNVVKGSSDKLSFQSWFSFPDVTNKMDFIGNDQMIVSGKGPSGPGVYWVH